jgi:hypothetical protein
MKRFVLATSTSLMLAGAFVPKAHADVPVIDVSSIAKQVEQYALQGKAFATQNLQWLKQVQQYATQVQQYTTEVDQLTAFVHQPSVGSAMGLLNTAGLGNSLPVSPYAVMNVVNGLGSAGAGGGFDLGRINGILSSLSSMGGSVYTANHVYSPTDGSWNSRQLIANGNALDGTQASALAAYQDYRTHADNLTTLRNQVMASTNPLDMAATQAQIAVEQTWTENANGQMQAVQTAAWTQQQLRQQRDNEEIAQSLADQLAQAKAAGVPGL